MNQEYLFIIIFSLLINIPLGFIREQYRKMSLAWLFWIHASIPLIIYLRITLNISSKIIPFTIALAVVGQIIGSRYRRSRLKMEK